MTPRRRLIHVLLALTVAAAMTGCSATSPTHGERWQIHAVYTVDTTPPLLPDDLARTTFITLGTSTVVGSTGCLLFTGDAHWSPQRDTVSFDVATRPEDCSGFAPHYSELIESFLGPTLAVTFGDRSVKLEQDNGQILELIR